jgi:hypothetical protein
MILCRESRAASGSLPRRCGSSPMSRQGSWSPASASHCAASGVGARPPAEQNPARHSRTMRSNSAAAPPKRRSDAATSSSKRLRRQAADFRSEATCPTGEPGQCLPAHARHRAPARPGRQERPRLGQAQPGHHASRSRHLVSNDDAFTADDGARRRQAGKDFERQAWQMQGQPEHDADQRALNGDWQGHWLRAATALEQTNDQLLPLAFERQPQRCRRGLTGTGQPDEKRTVVYDWPRQQAAGDAVTLLWASGSQATTAPTPSAASERSQPRQHPDRARWQPADATNQRRIHAAPAHRADAARPHRPARRVRRSTAAPALAAADSVHQPRDARAGVRSSRHAASRRRATHGQARQSRSAHRARVLWQAYRHARHRGDQGLRKRRG